VSHGLITHYFGTYEGLVEAVFARRTARLAERVMAHPQAHGASAAALMEILLGVVSEPVHLRLVAWAMLSGRAKRADLLPGRLHGMRPIADAACSEAKQRGARAPSRDDVDYALLLAVGAAYGWGLGKQPFLAALGRSSAPGTAR
jgi:TetR/AcrR family transcriptional regulator, repressor for neighboring sulfatase